MKTSDYLVFKVNHDLLSQNGQVKTLFPLIIGLLKSVKKYIPQLTHLHLSTFRIRFQPPKLYNSNYIHITNSFSLFGGFF